MTVGLACSLASGHEYLVGYTIDDNSDGQYSAGEPYWVRTPQAQASLGSVVETARCDAPTTKDLPFWLKK